MTTSEAACPNCGATTVQGQLVPTSNVGAGVLTALLTEDMAASVLVAQSGKMVVQAFCLTCGVSWLPSQLYLSQAVAGQRGEAARLKARKELQEIVSRGRGFKLVSEPDRQMATWAENLLAQASQPPGLRR